MANQILAGAVINAGQVIAGVDADNPPYVGPPAHWAETLYGVYSGGGSAGGGYSGTALLFNVPENDNTGISIMNDIDTKLTDNEVFKIEFRNSNKVVHSTVSPHRITMSPNPAYDDPEFNEAYYNGWRLNIYSEGDNIGNQLDPSVTLYQSGVSSQDTTVPSPTVPPENDGSSANATYNKWVAGDFAGFDQIYFYDQAGEVVVSMDLSHTRTGNGFDADGSASEATSLTTLIFPPVPYLAFGVQSYESSRGGVFLYDSRDISIEPIFLTDENELAYSYIGGSVAIHGTTLVAGARQARADSTDWGSAYVYDLTNPSASPTILKSDEGLSTTTQFGRSVSINSSHIFVGEDRTDSGSGANSGKVWAFNRNDLNATPIELAPAGLGAEDLFGGSYKLLSDDDIVVISSYGDDDGGSNAGAVYVFDASDLTAAPTKLSGTQASEAYGYNMAMNSTQLFISSPSWDVSSTDNTGKVSVYNKSTLSLVTTINMTGHKTGGDGFGYGVDATDDYVAIAAPYYDYNGQQSTGKIYVYNTSNLSSPIGQLTPATVAGNNIGMDNGVFIDGTTLYVGNKNARHSDVGLSGSHAGQGKGAVYQYDINNLGADPVVFNPQFIKDSTSRFGFGSDIVKDRS